MIAAALRSDQPLVFRPAILAPTYDNGGTLGELLRRLDATGLTVFVINDGSIDRTAEILAAWASAGHDRRRVVLTHPRNRGKAAALRTGFAAAAEAGFTHVVTIDTDGQHQPEDVAPMIETARANPQTLVVGVRDESAADYPARSRVGRRLSNLMIWLESGARVEDSQCGLRVYPLALVNNVRCRAGHFGFETEIVTRAAWAGFDVVGVPVRCIYLPVGQRVSHFKPWIDTFRALAMHGNLLLRAINPWPMRRLVVPMDTDAADRGGLRTFLDWINPMRAWREIRSGRIGRANFAMGFALGVFIANLPLYGLQTVLCLYSARRLHLHPVPVVVGSHISTPPLGSVLVVAAITVGHVLLHGALPSSADYDVTRLGLSATIMPILLEWLVGGIVVGLALAAVAFVSTSLVFAAAFARGSTQAAAPISAAGEAE